MSEEIEKSIRPEVTKEQLGMVIESLMEAIESMIESPEVESEDAEMESEDATEIEDMSKSEDYQSDNEDEDKWDNLQKSCWAGYKQVGMKDKNGKQVPNCVPIESVKKSLWDGKFNPSSIKK